MIQSEGTPDTAGKGVQNHQIHLFSHVKLVWPRLTDEFRVIHVEALFSFLSTSILYSVEYTNNKITVYFPFPNSVMTHKSRNVEYIYHKRSRKTIYILLKTYNK